MKDYKPRCSSCGVYCGYNSDNGTIYGCADPEAPEPYDPEYWCKKCAKTEYKKALKKGTDMYIYWKVPNWQAKALKRLGLIKRVEMGMPRIIPSPTPPQKG